VLEAAPIGVVISAEGGAIVSANPALETMFGYRPGTLVGRSLEVLLPERLRPAHARHRASYFAAPRTRPMGIGQELVGLRADGREFPIEVSLSFLRAGERPLAIGFVTDISRRREIEGRLYVEFEVTRALLESPTLLDAVPRLIRVACEHLDWEVGELWLLDPAGGLRWYGLWQRPGVDAGALERASRGAVLTAGVGLPGRAWQSGRALWVRELPGDGLRRRREAFKAMGLQTALAVPIARDGRTTGVMTFFSRDAREADDGLLTAMNDMGARIASYVERKRLQDDLARHREALSHSEKLAALGTLTAGLAHELNNPLGIISSRVELMLVEAAEHGLSRTVIEDLQVVHRNLQRVARLAQALRAFGRQSGREHVPVDLNKVVEESVLLVQKTLAAENIRMDATLAPGTLMVAADPNALQQVMLNLITNAREAMSQGGVIRLATAPVTGAPAHVRITVADDGPGIPAEHLPRIFDPFYTTKPQGTGLGLSVTYGIVEEHRGRITVDSAPGRGTTFVITLPALDAAASA